jgi:hypothetical protein
MKLISAYLRVCFQIPVEHWSEKAELASKPLSHREQVHWVYLWSTKFWRQISAFCRSFLSNLFVQYILRQMFLAAKVHCYLLRSHLEKNVRNLENLKHQWFFSIRSQSYKRNLVLKNTNLVLNFLVVCYLNSDCKNTIWLDLNWGNKTNLSLS